MKIFPAASLRREAHSVNLPHSGRHCSRTARQWPFRVSSHRFQIKLVGYIVIPTTLPSQPPSPNVLLLQERHGKSEQLGLTMVWFCSTNMVHRKGVRRNKLRYFQGSGYNALSMESNLGESENRDIRRMDNEKGTELWSKGNEARTVTVKKIQEASGRVSFGGSRMGCLK